MFPVHAGQSLRHGFLGRVTRIMARLLARSAERVFVSIPAWGKLLQTLCPTVRPAEWLPVPSNVPALADAALAAAVRRKIVAGLETVIGHFGTFGTITTPCLGPALADLLRRSPNRIGLLIGRSSLTYREQFAATYPDLSGLVKATGELPAAAVSAHLAACDLLLQPYPDGASCRRTSLMSGLALGVPTVTNKGFLSEPVWGTESAGVAVAPSAHAADLVATAEAVLALPPAERQDRGRAAAGWYKSRFALEHTIARLRTDLPQTPD
jgi:hypothetical protein